MQASVQAGVPLALCLLCMVCATHEATREGIFDHPLAWPSALCRHCTCPGHRGKEAAGTAGSAGCPCGRVLQDCGDPAGPGLPARFLPTQATTLSGMGAGGAQVGGRSHHALWCMVPGCVQAEVAACGTLLTSNTLLHPLLAADSCPWWCPTVRGALTTTLPTQLPSAVLRGRCC